MKLEGISKGIPIGLRGGDDAPLGPLYIDPDFDQMDEHPKASIKMHYLTYSTIQ